MLIQLRIRQLAIIDQLSLDFGPGFNVLTGETGAGKSILIDALGMVLGMRADSSLVRHGAERAQIEAEFDLGDAEAARRWLVEHDMLDADDDRRCVIRRILTAEGRSRSFINESAASTASLRELGPLLIDIFGQNESQTLLRSDVQRQLLDQFGQHGPLLADCAQAASAWQATQRELERLQAMGAEDPQQLEYLRYQLRELEGGVLDSAELEALEHEHRRLANSGALLSRGSLACEQLYDGERSAFDLLAAVSAELQALGAFDARFGAAGERLANAQEDLREAAETLRSLLDGLDMDPERLAECESRIAAIQDLARKHRLRPEQLPARRDELRLQLQDIEQAGARRQVLQTALEAQFAAWHQAAGALRAARQQAGTRLAEAVQARVRLLGLPQAQLRLSLQALDSQRPRADGDDDVSIDFSANPGQAPRPLARVASGGELSRLSLAIQVSVTASDGAATMIFDEVDAGIGGGVAEIVGQQLRELGNARQVLCVTHLAQVASQGRRHFAIRKEVLNEETYTRVSELADEARIEELARMLGGVDLSESTRQLARELVQRGALLC